MYQYVLLPHFNKQFKRLLRKFRNLDNDLDDLMKDFDIKNAQFLGKKLYKIRLKPSDVPRGRNKSLRVIVFIVKWGELVAPIAIFAKKDKDNLSWKEIVRHFNIILEELRNYEQDL
jgi:hypothetical protein